MIKRLLHSKNFLACSLAAVNGLVLYMRCGAERTKRTIAPAVRTSKSGNGFGFVSTDHRSWYLTRVSRLC